MRGSTAMFLLPIAALQVTGAPVVPSSSIGLKLSSGGSRTLVREAKVPSSQIRDVTVLQDGEVSNFVAEEPADHIMSKFIEMTAREPEAPQSLPEAGVRRSADQDAVDASANGGPGPLPNRFLYVGVLSAPQNIEKRNKIRKAWMDNLREKHGTRVRAEFVIGHEVIKGKVQGQDAQNSAGRAGYILQGSKSDDQLETEKKLEKEASEHGDLLRIPLPDSYSALPDKVLQMVGAGVEGRYQYIIKIDDDRSFNYEETEKFLKDRDPRKLLYAGHQLWDKAYYPIQHGVDDVFAQYFGGPSYLLSYQLAFGITKAHGTHSASFIRYGSSSEDVDMGFWASFEGTSGGAEVEKKVFPLSDLLEKPPPGAPGAVATVGESRCIRLASEPGLCLKAQYDKLETGSKLVLGMCSGQDSQRFQLLANGAMHSLAKPDLCINKQAAAPGGPASLLLGPCSGDAAIAISGHAEPTAGERSLRETSGEQRCLTVSHADLKDIVPFAPGADVRLGPCNAQGEHSTFQLWNGFEANILKKADPISKVDNTKLLAQSGTASASLLGDVAAAVLQGGSAGSSLR